MEDYKDYEKFDLTIVYESFEVLDKYSKDIEKIVATKYSELGARNFYFYPIGVLVQCVEFEAIERDLEVMDLGDGISTTIGRFSNWLPEVAVERDDEW
ncbi:uncharacterized protein EURHEDRAFT_408157 [Aspergillus ruber CBS 135680]|uniref:Uncharacterized protein n=1 Tax=Aspergillus ruber (strain CBS 135680) TaxID=1388766 RepID=A0A017SQR3_ASPRC|nr:uncharacterized protein EURHEDRAFT_408157 [Aspergillus ruber CBS 135680]EYE98934.1 hypothetical protein EURHEDRAFT_408157 [Aspergillus ruber CBS 135680]